MTRIQNVSSMSSLVEQGAALSYDVNPKYGVNAQLLYFSSFPYDYSMLWKQVNIIYVHTFSVLYIYIIKYDEGMFEVSYIISSKLFSNIGYPMKEG